MKESPADSRPVILIGGGGHGKVLLDALRLRGVNVVGYTDPQVASGGLAGLERLGGDEAVANYAAAEVFLVNAVGGARTSTKRREIFERFKRHGYKYHSVAHPSAVIADDVVCGEGVQFMAGSIVQPGSSIGDNTIINTHATIDHDCEIGSHVHVAPGATLSGGVRLSDGVHIGTGACVIQGVQIGAASTVGAGAVVLADIPDNVTVVGIPARAIGP